MFTFPWREIAHDSKNINKHLIRSHGGSPANNSVSSEISPQRMYIIGFGISQHMDLNGWIPGNSL
jgi:hypothetical protein